MIRCVHSALRGLCGFRACEHYGKATPPNRFRDAKPNRSSGPGHITPMLGRTFGRWTVLGRFGRMLRKDGGAAATWLCRHDCEHQGEDILPGQELRRKPPTYCSKCRPANLKPRVKARDPKRWLPC